MFSYCTRIDNEIFQAHFYSIWHVEWTDFLNPVNLTKSWRFLVRDGKNKKMSKNALWGCFFNVGSILHAFQTICNIFQNLTFLTLVTPKRVQGQTEVI